MTRGADAICADSAHYVAIEAGEHACRPMTAEAQSIIHVCVCITVCHAQTHISRLNTVNNV